MARTILDTVSRDYDIPVLNISLDEHSGEAGFLTRVEAFIDLLERRRAKKTEEASLLEARAI
jgi:predicted nucleotide-binding protein (sugar kinase/HSP70/actin superfamily)